MLLICWQDFGFWQQMKISQIPNYVCNWTSVIRDSVQGGYTWKILEDVLWEILALNTFQCIFDLCGTRRAQPINKKCMLGKNFALMLCNFLPFSKRCKTLKFDHHIFHMLQLSIFPNMIHGTWQHAVRIFDSIFWPWMIQVILIWSQSRNSSMLIYVFKMFHCTQFKQHLIHLFIFLLNWFGMYSLWW